MGGDVVTKFIDLWQWTNAVLVLGNETPRHIHRAELNLIAEGDDEWTYRLSWWHESDDHATEFFRSIPDLETVDRHGMRGRHDDLAGGIIAVVALDR